MLAAFFMENMNEKDPFAETNPFLRLRKDLPQRKPLNAEAVKDVQQQHEQACEDKQDEDLRLFLQAVRALPLKKKSSGKTLELVAHTEAFATPRLFFSKAEKAAQPCVATTRQNLQDILKPSERNIPVLQRGRASDAHDTKVFIPDKDVLDFAGAMHDVRPLKNKGGRDVPRCAAPPPDSEPRQQSFQELLEHTLEFALSFSEEYVEGHVVGLESLIMQKLRAGQYTPEAHLDLHGFNAHQAFDALVAFVRRSWYRGMRTLLLIPGRGRNSPNGVAVLRERVQSWLTQEPLKRVILAFCTAKPLDGGPGSLYVLLRKYKKKGKVIWERCPIDVEF